MPRGGDRSYVGQVPWHPARGTASTAWPDMSPNRTPHPAVFPASAVHRSPRTPYSGLPGVLGHTTSLDAKATQNRRYGTGTHLVIHPVRRGFVPTLWWAGRLNASPVARTLPTSWRVARRPCCSLSGRGWWCGRCTEADRRRTAEQQTAGGGECPLRCRLAERGRGWSPPGRPGRGGRGRRTLLTTATPFRLDAVELPRVGRRVTRRPHAAHGSDGSTAAERLDAALPAFPRGCRTPGCRCSPRPHGGDVHHPPRELRVRGPRAVGPCTGPRSCAAPATPHRDRRRPPCRRTPCQRPPGGPRPRRWDFDTHMITGIVPALRSLLYERDVQPNSLRARYGAPDGSRSRNGSRGSV